LPSIPPEKRKFVRKSQLWSEDLTAKLFCNVECWLERLPKLIGLFEGVSIAIRNSAFKSNMPLVIPDPLLTLVIPDPLLTPCLMIDGWK
jgi:hypothetical protein